MSVLDFLGDAAGRAYGATPAGQLAQATGVDPVGGVLDYIAGAWDDDGGAPPPQQDLSDDEMLDMALEDPILREFLGGARYDDPAWDQPTGPGLPAPPSGPGLPAPPLPGTPMGGQGGPMGMPQDYSHFGGVYGGQFVDGGAIDDALQGLPQGLVQVVMQILQSGAIEPVFEALKKLMRGTGELPDLTAECARRMRETYLSDSVSAGLDAYACGFKPIGEDKVAKQVYLALQLYDAGYGTKKSCGCGE